MSSACISVYPMTFYCPHCKPQKMSCSMDPTQAWNCHSTYREHAGAAVPWGSAMFHLQHDMAIRGVVVVVSRLSLAKRKPDVTGAESTEDVRVPRFNRLLTTPFDVVASVNQAVTGDMKSDATRFVLGFEVHQG